MLCSFTVTWFGGSVLHAGLELVEVAVRVICELFVATGLQDFAFAEQEEDVAVADGAQAVSDHDRSAALHCPVQSLLHDLLAVLIKSGGGLVEDEDLGVLDEGAGDGDALLLAARELAALQAAVLVEALVQDELSIGAALLVNCPFL